MPNLKKIIKTIKLTTGIGGIKKPPDWPKNGFEEELKKSGGFRDSIMSSATGRENKSLALYMNAKIINARDQQILEYLRSKGIEL